MRGITIMGKQKYTEKKKASNKKWDDANLKRGAYAMSIELYDIFENYCKNKNISKNGLICELVKEKLKSEGFLKADD